MSVDDVVGECGGDWELGPIAGNAASFEGNLDMKSNRETSSDIANTYGFFDVSPILDLVHQLSFMRISLTYEVML